MLGRAGFSLLDFFLPPAGRKSKDRPATIPADQILVMFLKVSDNQT